MQSFTIFFRVLDEAAVLEAAAQMLVRTNSCSTIEAAREDIASNVGNALRLLMDQAIGESPVGDLIEIQDTTCTID